MAGVVATRLLIAMAILAVELLAIALLGPYLIETPSCTFLNRSSNASSTSSPPTSSSSLRCEGRRVFVYDLPPQFNADLARSCDNLIPWASMCPALSNSGLGSRIVSSAPASSGSFSSFFKPWLWRRRRKEQGDDDDDEESWYATDQFSGEVIFHHRMLDHECRTLDPEAAVAFFIPYYAGLDVSRFLWTSAPAAAAEVDRLGQELLHWLNRSSPHFRRRGGSDHFLVAGRITWDFRRLPQRRGEWGSSLFHTAAMANVTRLLIERSPWDERDLGVPYPTGFHPSSAAAVASWQRRVTGAPRAALFAFAGSPRPGFGSSDFRRLLLRQCKAAPPSSPCSWLSCKQASAAAAAQPPASGACGSDPLAVTKLFMGSSFCLQPRGDSFTRRSIFDAMIAGCIPVFFWEQSAYWQYQLYLPQDPEAYSVFIPAAAVRNSTSVTSIADALAAVPLAVVAAKRAAIVDMIPRLVYANGAASKGFKDAFDIAVEGVIQRIAAAESGSSFERY